jgi:hypothetical protein
MEFEWVMHQEVLIDFESYNFNFKAFKWKAFEVIQSLAGGFLLASYEIQ